jgi:hypothetical protein
MVGNAVQGAMDGQRDIRGQLMLRGLPLGTVPVVNVENACASASSALHLAVAYVGSGMADVVLAVGAEKMVSPDRQRSLDAFSGSWDESVRAETLGGLAVFGQGTPVPDGVEDLATRSVFMDAYASFARQHMARWGSTVEQFAAVAAKNHGHSVHNPRAQYRRPFTVEKVLGGRTIARPLTLPMCSPVSDGAAAALISLPAANRLGRRRAVRIRASVLGHGGAWTGAEPDEHVSPTDRRRLWETAGVGPGDVDLDDCSAALCLTDDSFAGTLATHTPTPLQPIGGTDDDLNRAEPIPLIRRAATDDAWLFYTSGTAGRAKGARLSHANLLATAHFADVSPAGPDDSLLHAAALPHASGLFALSFLGRGATQVLPASGGFDVDEVVAVVAADRRTTLFVPPVLLRRLIAGGAAGAVDPARLGTLLVGAAPARRGPAGRGRVLRVPGLERLRPGGVAQLAHRHARRRRRSQPRPARPADVRGHRPLRHPGARGRRGRPAPAARRGRRGRGVRADGDGRLPQPSRGDRRGAAGRLAAHRRPGPLRRRGIPDGRSSPGLRWMRCAPRRRCAGAPGLPALGTRGASGPRTAGPHPHALRAGGYRRVDVELRRD